MRELDRFKLYRARSRLYRSQILQVNTRWNALAEIYTKHCFAPFSKLKFLLKLAEFFAFFFGRRRLKKRSEKTEIARSKRKHRKRKREGASVREDSQPPPPGLETCSSSRRKSSRVWGTNKTRISRNFGGVRGISREFQERKTRWQQPERHVSEICGHRPKQ